MGLIIAFYFFQNYRTHFLLQTLLVMRFTMMTQNVSGNHLLVKLKRRHETHKKEGPFLSKSYTKSLSKLLKNEPAVEYIL